MCLVAFAWQTAPNLPLVVAANRDEFHARPTQPLDWWEDAPDIAAGRDLQAGGSWMGVHRGGRFAALTNFREMQQTPKGAPSRGELVANFLAGEMTPQAFTAHIDYRAYAGFSLLLCDGQSMWFCSNRPKPHASEVTPGTYALSNGELDSHWPKVERARGGLERLMSGECATSLSPDALIEIMSYDQPAPDADLPDTGVGRDTERFLSPLFIRGDNYGTRATTAVIWDAHKIAVTERRFDAGGAVIGEQRLSTPV